MRRSPGASLLLVALLAIGAPRAEAQISVRLGRSVSVNLYSPQRYGEWRTTYQYWQPVTLYYLDGRYYVREVREARPVVVYRWRSDYFLPPEDPAWVRFRHDNGLHKGHFKRNGHRP